MEKWKYHCQTVAPLAFYLNVLTPVVIFRETPADYDFKWHPAPARQLLFIIKGRAEFKVSNGERHVFGAGDVLLLEDTEGEGHCSRAMYNEVRHSIFVTLPDHVTF